LVKFTYYGDANLDGKVDGADYSRIDAGYLAHGAATGWFNGDFDYDGAINGSDYTLIDNAFNTQGAALPATQVAGSEAGVDMLSSESGTHAPGVVGFQQVPGRLVAVAGAAEIQADNVLDKLVQRTSRRKL
jgi:hypothetical protein